jgi:hypothetical protein
MTGGAPLSHVAALAKWTHMLLELHLPFRAPERSENKR